ncbi:M48 family metallopeptidase [Azovibrio restrictus]|uniref:M48 family metallopeptidase n=1 Tax=Azovibrio restrictus TaxID=146938 RepID=UPI0026E9A46F|nr:M48 family metallopeptidase [Azovibrio restrictus]MDD3481475.1 M48 family metallopeptidase [Azovibrio restrictus]
MEAAYFDGRSSRRQRVRLRAEAGFLLLAGEGVERRVPLAGLEISEPQGRAPRTLRFADGAYCEAPQDAALLALLEELGHRESTTVRLQGGWRWSIGALAAIVLVLAGFYQWGLPWGAQVVAPLIPAAALEQVSNQTLTALDKGMLKESRLPREYQERLTRGFLALAAADPALKPYRKSLKLHFRSAPRIGPNAFALPDGQVVLFDELVQMPASDAEVLAVLAHELGHVRERHGLRQLIQSSVVAAFTAAYLGDVSSLAAGLSTLALTSKYSRDMEREADDYAATTLRRQGHSPAELGSALEKLARAHADEEGEEEGKDWLSSHPDTRERIRRLNSQ